MAIVPRSTTEIATPELQNIDFISRLRCKDVQAFQTLYENYSRVLYRLAIRSTRDNFVAEDILQNVFLKIWINIHLFNPQKSGLYSWMVRITRNEIIDFYRASATKKRRCNNFILTDFTGGPEQDVINKLDIRRLMNTLSNQQKLMLSLLYLKGYTYSETAMILNLPVGTVKSQVRSLFKRWRLPLYAIS